MCLMIVYLYPVLHVLRVDFYQILCLNLFMNIKIVFLVRSNFQCSLLIHLSNKQNIQMHEYLYQLENASLPSKSYKKRFSVASFQVGHEMASVQGVSRSPVQNPVILHSGVRTVLSVCLAPLEVTEYAVQLVRMI